MKCFLSGILLLSGCLTVFGTQVLKAQTSVLTNSQPKAKLFYTYYGQKIPLNLQQDTVAISFKPEAEHRASLPLHLKLQLDLHRSVGEKSSNLQVKLLGKDYALMKITSKTRRYTTKIQKLLRKQTYVETTLPVFTRGKYSRQIKDQLKETIILPNEIILNFEARLSQDQKQEILQQYNLEIIRPLRFSPNRYLVKSLSASGTEVLDVANQLYQVDGIKSATPNFTLSLNLKNSTKAKTAIDTLSKSPTQVETPFQTSLLPLQWHLNSAPLNFCLNKFPNFVNKCLRERLFNNSESLQPSTDIRVVPAWSKSNPGKGVVVAVLDDFIQWNHPDLINNIYRVGKVKDKLKGEKHGWDFVDNDPDTRISPRELSMFRPIFRDSFVLSDEQLLEKYADDPFLQELFSVRKELIKYVTSGQIAKTLRNHIREEVSNLFHGTWVSGVIAAHPPDKKGAVGVAPNAKILPIKISNTVYNPSSGFETMYQISHIIEGIGYAVARGADIINMSYGSYLPTADETDTIMKAQQQNPSLVFVAAVGNESTWRIGFPAAIKGVIGVGAINFNGNRASYSNFGNELVLVAPGGDVSSPFVGVSGGILTTGGTWIDELWEGIGKRKYSWNTLPLSKGKYIWVEGTSFASPMVAGVVALMKGEDPQRILTREEIIAILKRTASYKGLKLSKTEKALYQLLTKRGKIPRSVSAQQYFFGSGLINADAAVREVQNQLEGNRVQEK